MEANRLPPTILAIFGISGDLSHRYLLPALSEIRKSSAIGDIRILGISRRQIKPEEIFTSEAADLKDIASILTMDPESNDDYKKLADEIENMARAFDSEAQVIFYLSVPPNAAQTIVEHLGANELNQPNMKLLLEKPFGYDLASAQDLVQRTSKYFKEDQVYRIDHYLAKEVAQNITVFLGSNTLFRDVWSKDFIESVEVLVAESIGIEGRANFYEKTGALRDIAQSHLLQLAALVLMEPCADIFDFAEIPKRRLEALQQLKVSPANVIRGQYEGYRHEVDNPQSRVETFVAINAESNADRWRAVPIKLITGKHLSERLTEIRINFKKASERAANQLIFRIQPNESIEFDLWVKEPGYDRKLQKLKWNFDYDQHFAGRLPNAYEMVIVDAMRSNHSLFTSSAEVLASWQILQPVLDNWHGNDDGLIIYRPGSSAEQVVSEAQK